MQTLGDRKIDGPFFGAGDPYPLSLLLSVGDQVCKAKPNMKIRPRLTRRIVRVSQRKKPSKTNMSNNRPGNEFSREKSGKAKTLKEELTQ